MLLLHRYYYLVLSNMDTFPIQSNNINIAGYNLNNLVHGAKGIDRKTIFKVKPIAKDASTYINFRDYFNHDVEFANAMAYSNLAELNASSVINFEVSDTSDGIFTFQINLSQNGNRMGDVHLLNIPKISIPYTYKLKITPNINLNALFIWINPINVQEVILE